VIDTSYYVKVISKTLLSIVYSFTILHNSWLASFFQNQDIFPP